MTPLVLLVGFLGAGKTTLLRACLPDLSARGLAPSVILNDYINARVDAVTLAGLVDELTPIGGTCVCCDSRGELVDALVDARLGPRSLMLVEANGTVDAGDLIEILTADVALGRYTLPVQVSVVDATRWQRGHWYDPLQAEQVRTAAFVVITRAESATAGQLDEVRAAVARLAPGALIVDREGLCEQMRVLVGLCADGVTRRFDAAPGNHDHHHHDHGRHHFSALEIPLPRKVDRGRLEAWLQALPAQVVRAKGVAHLGEEGWVYFSRLDSRDGLSIRRVTSVDLDPVAILIGAGFPAGVGAGAATLASTALGSWRPKNGPPLSEP